MRRVVSRVETHEEEAGPSRGVGWYGMMFFLASEAVFFANLIASYLYLRVRAGHWEPPAGVELDKTLPIINTIILLSSSFPMHWAARSISRGNRGNLTKGLIATAVLGTLFPSGHAWGYTHAGFRPGTRLFRSVVFPLTGLPRPPLTPGVLFLLGCFFP